MSLMNTTAASGAQPQPAELDAAGLARLRASEDPGAVASDLRKQGRSPEEIRSLFRDAARQQRRSGLIMLIGGALLSLVIFLIVWGAMDAGFTCSGPGLLVGLFVMVRGILKLKNGSEIATVSETLGSQP